jgi:hypothetical protein
MNYANIDIQITNDPRQSHNYLVAATTRGRKTAQVAFQLAPQFREDLEALLGKLHARTVSSDDERSVQSFGEQLFDALIQGAVRVLYDERATSARQNGSGLRLCLHVLPLELITLPWEILYDRRQSEYLCLTENPKIVFLRRPAQVRRTRPEIYHPPLRVLLMTADPKDLPPLAGQQEESYIREALQKLEENDQVSVESKRGTSLELQDLRLGENPVHTYHFIGHGSFNTTDEEGQLAFENENRKAKYIPASRFRRSLPRHHPDLCVKTSRKQASRERKPMHTLKAIEQNGKIQYRQTKISRKSALKCSCYTGHSIKQHLLLLHPLRLVASLSTTVSTHLLANWDFGQMNSLQNGPHDGHATGFRRESVNLIGTPPNIAKQTFDRVGAADIPMHHRREGIKS